MQSSFGAATKGSWIASLRSQRRWLGRLLVSLDLHDDLACCDLLALGDIDR
jgi:hypothetical protein